MLSKGIGWWDGGMMGVWRLRGLVFDFLFYFIFLLGEFNRGKPKSKSLITHLSIQ